MKEEEKFSKEFVAKEYLKNYYAKVDFPMLHKYVIEKTPASETLKIMIFMDLVCNPLIKATFGGKKPQLLELGGGPTLYQLMNIIEHVGSVYFTDYVEDNLNEIRKWKNKQKDAFNWHDTLKAALELKKDTVNISEKEISSLENELRNKITKIEFCDVFKKGMAIEKKGFDIINTHFVAESATNSKKKWESAIYNMSKKLNKDGLLFMSALLGAKGSYKVLDKNFPAVELNEIDIEKTFKKTGLSLIRTKSIRFENKDNNYEGFIFIVAKNDGKK